MRANDYNYYHDYHLHYANHDHYIHQATDEYDPECPLNLDNIEGFVGFDQEAK